VSSLPACLRAGTTAFASGTAPQDFSQAGRHPGGVQDRGKVGVEGLAVRFDGGSDGPDGTAGNRCLNLPFQLAGGGELWFHGRLIGRVSAAEGAPMRVPPLRVAEGGKTVYSRR
jgi:hypothetical protein